MEPIVYANGSTLEDPAISYGIVFSNFMKKGVWTFKGGTDHLIKMMQEELLSNNVDIKKHAKIEKIIIENGKACGVEFKGERVLSKSVLSNGNLKSTIFGMIGDKHFKPEYLEKAQAVRLNSSSSQVYMGIKPGMDIPYIGELVFTSSHPKFDSKALLAKKITSRTFSCYYPEARPYDTDKRYAIVSSTNSNYEDWINLSEEEYEAEKKIMIDETIESLKTYIPDIEDRLDFVDAATPLTVKKYTHHRGGASFGTKFEGLEVSMNMHKEIPGMFHAGSVGIIMSGWLGAANYGVIQANEVESYLYYKEKEETESINI
jgi:phytoene dehydrogenase-like protein